MSHAFEYIMTRLRTYLCVTALTAPALLAGRPNFFAAEPPRPAAVRQELLGYLNTLQPELTAVSQDIWAYAELGLQEYRSAARLVGVLKKAGFRVREGIS